MRRAKALPDCICNLPCTAVGARLLWRLVTAKVLRSSTSNNESGDGLKRLSKICRGRYGPLRRSVRLLLPWLEDVSVHHARGLAASGVMCCSEPAFGSSAWATSKGSGSHYGLLSKVRRLFGWFVPRGFPRTNHPLLNHLADQFFR